MLDRETNKRKNIICGDFVRKTPIEYGEGTCFGSMWHGAAR